MVSLMKCYPVIFFATFLLGAVCLSGSSVSVEKNFDGWITAYTREEIKPEFKVLPSGGRNGSSALAIITGDQEGLNGGWRKRFPVTGGEWYSLTVFRKSTGVELARRNTLVEVTFSDEKGNSVPDSRIPGWNSRPYYPLDQETSNDGWTRISDTYRAPEAATFATIDLRLRWDANGEVRYSQFSWENCPTPKPRIARLAAVHYTPHGGKTPMDNCKQFEPLIADAGRQKADLVVLGECITIVNNGHDLVSAAELIPGPSTEYFGKLAKQHNLYIVVGLYERAGPLIYNTAALIGPDGELAGKYRKVCPSRNEFQKGITPGSTYPVFDTRFGKLGMMVCYDVHMPEVARNIAANGAEVIALPIWGGDPSLAKARAIENQIILISSTYTNMKDWMKTAVWDREGVKQATTENQGEVVLYEVDLSQRHVRPNNTGDFRSRIPRERPPNPPET
jgi:predicted amidohydrolase